jgi:ATP/maltotriose-dependent transcriptional regulator MalT
LLTALVGSVAATGGAGQIVGEAGIGKTSLLSQVAREAAADGLARVIWLHGLESEAVLPFAVAADLLIPLVDKFGELPATQRQALEVALALDTGPAPSRLAACSGALGVLAAAGDEQPLVVLIDDLQWVDPESARLLVFAARRLASERVVMLFASRIEPGVPLVAPDLPTLQLPGLSAADCQELVDRRQLHVPSVVLHSVVQATGGNPLALLETLSRDGSSAADGSGGGLEHRVTVGGSARHAWNCVLRRLPEATRQALFVVAISRSAGMVELAQSLAAVSLSLSDLEPAENTDLVRLDASGIELRHPLLRRVLVDGTPMAFRLEVYRALAQLGPPELRVWYLSQTVNGPDDEVADQLDAAARDVRGRSGYSAALRLSRRAAELTADPRQRAERLLEAATDAQLAGDSPSAALWSGQALQLRDDPSFTVAASLIRGRALSWLGQPAQSFEALVQAARRTVVRDPSSAAELYAEAVAPAMMTGDLHRAQEAVQHSESVRPPRAAPSFRAQVLAAEVEVLRGAVAAGRARLAAAELRLPEVDPVTSQESMVHLAFGRCWTEDFEAARSLIDAALDFARQRGAPCVLSLALAARSELDHWAGRWAGAVADAVESLQWAQELDQAGMIGNSLVRLARLDAARGDRDQAEARVEQCRRQLGPHGIDGLRVHEAAVLGLAALGHGEVEAAIEHLESAWTSAQAHGLVNPNVAAFLPDLVEAHVHGGNRDRALELLGVLEGLARTTRLAYPTATAARCRGLLAQDVGDAADAFAAAHAAHATRPMPFELARTVLCEGEMLRRERHPAAARSVLRQALASFEVLGARRWAQRAAVELSAAGARTTDTRATAAGLALLTPQEVQIARMVADGRSNAEAAAALFVSGKTIEAHLTRVYRKLAVRSRTDLARVLAENQVLK